MTFVPKFLRKILKSKSEITDVSFVLLKKKKNGDLHEHDYSFRLVSLGPSVTPLQNWESKFMMSQTFPSY